MRRFLLTALLFFTACGTSTGSGGTNLDISPKPGLWQGQDLSFRLVGGKITDLTLAPHACTGAQSCNGSISGALAGEWPSTTYFKATPTAGTVSGSFYSNTNIAGTLQVSTGPCCTVIAAWTAVWVGDDDAGISGDASTVDGGGTNDSSAGGSTWNGASFGTIHPGPSRSDPSPAAHSCFTTDQQQAVDLLNDFRNAVGAPVVDGDCALAKASKAHADFYVGHIAQYNKSGLSPHNEDETYGAGFTGVNFWDRDSTAGFTGQPSGEVIAFIGTPGPALQGWIDTVYHRLPLLSPTTQLIGYGAKKSGGTATDVIDTSARNALKTDPVIVWPWPGQTNVASSWNGLEGPTPPSPPGGFPSGPVITAQFWKTTPISAHELTDENGTAVAHTWLDQKTDANLKNLAPETVALYANKPLSAGTYSVKLTTTAGDVLAWRFSVGQ